MKITALENVGAEVTDVDLNQISSEDFRAIQQAFASHGLLFFRDQDLTEEAHITFAERWGSINVNRFFTPHDRHPQIAVVAKEPDQTTNIGGGWHTDHSYDEIPALGSILVARTLPPAGGATRFVSMYKAFEALSPGLKEMLRQMRAVHSAHHVFGTQAERFLKQADLQERFSNAEAADALSEPVHPVVIRHPLSGQPALYVNPGFTRHFEGWSAEDSAPLLQHLYEIASSEQRQQVFEWRSGSIAFWDNRATWHFADNDYHGHTRLMHRITLDGCPLHAAA